MENKPKKPQKDKQKEPERVGRVVQVIGPVVDVEFKSQNLPEIFNAIRITSEGFDTETPVDIIVEGLE